MGIYYIDKEASKKGDAIMDLKTIYVMDYDVLRGTKENLYHDLFENIPICFNKKKYITIEVESIPKENEIILYHKNHTLMVMSVYKVIYYEWKVFIIVNNTEGDLRSMEKSAIKEVSNLAAFSIISSSKHAM